MASVRPSGKDVNTRFPIMSRPATTWSGRKFFGHVGKYGVDGNSASMVEMALLAVKEFKVNLVEWAVVRIFFGNRSMSEKYRDLGRVLIGQEEAEAILSAEIKMTKWLLALKKKRGNLSPPPRLGLVLSNRWFIAWSIRHVNGLAKDDHNDWPVEIRQGPDRAAILKRRQHVLGICRVSSGEADTFIRTCRDFIETYCEPIERIRQSEFLTLAATAFADHVKQARSLDDLPTPPWYPPDLFNR